MDQLCQNWIRFTGTGQPLVTCAVRPGAVLSERCQTSRVFASSDKGGLVGAGRRSPPTVTGRGLLVAPARRRAVKPTTVAGAASAMR